MRAWHESEKMSQKESDHLQKGSNTLLYLVGPFAINGRMMFGKGLQYTNGMPGASYWYALGISSVGI